MLSTAQLCNKYFKSSEHPYRKYEEKILSTLKNTDTILDAGCGRSAPILRKFYGKTKTLIGVDLEEPTKGMQGIKYIKGDISSIDISSNTVDVVISRAVLEHVSNPIPIFKEIHRILKPGGSFVFLVPNLGDYVSILSKLIPNRFHKYIISKTEGRKIDDVFPTYYNANTYSSIKKLSNKNGFTIEAFLYLGQYPSIFMFNPFCFILATIYEKIISRFEFFGFLRGWLLVQVKKNQR